MTLPNGYRYASTYAGIRKAKKDDLALIVSDSAAVGAAVFTQNLVKAAPVIVAKRNLERSQGKLRAIIVNAGNANCATRTGMTVAEATCDAVGKELGVPGSHVMPASTGVIGVELNPNLITNAVPTLVKRLSPERLQDVAEAMMTTDLVPKTSFAEVAVTGGTVRIAGITKGSGMIHPNMATTLGFILTDARIGAATARRVLTTAVNSSYNCMSVDGDMSTNDVLALMANSASGVTIAARDMPVFQDAVSNVARHLAEQIARDGEGASKLITILVNGAANEAAATRIARAIANSPLVKTAMAGNDPNWGRIICAAGYSGVKFDPSKVDIAIQGVPVCVGGLAAPFSEAELKKKLAATDCRIEVNIRGRGHGQARFWTCDLTDGYIRINASYRT
ncbi:MAG: bifunctional glutamate N-acetyltransferase/amino-acid acetyltransferase ArgJ [Bryobacteraceae bacterium]